MKPRIFVSSTFYDYFEDSDILLAECRTDLDEILIENKRFYENAIFRDSLINQLVKNESYNMLFEE